MPLTQNAPREPGCSGFGAILVTLPSSMVRNEPHSAEHSQQVLGMISFAGRFEGGIALRAPLLQPLLPRFKEEFAKHKEYLLAPVLKGADGKLWARPELGIIKRQIHFRSIADIKPDDIDAAALVLPQLIRPPGEANSDGAPKRFGGPQ